MEFRNRIDLDERNATIELLKAHVIDSEKRGARLISMVLSALISEIEDEMQYDEEHIRRLIEG